MTRTYNIDEAIASGFFRVRSRTSGGIFYAWREGDNLWVVKNADTKHEKKFDKQTLMDKFNRSYFVIFDIGLAVFTPGYWAPLHKGEKGASDLGARPVFLGPPAPPAEPPLVTPAFVDERRKKALTTYHLAVAEHQEATSALIEITEQRAKAQERAEKASFAEAEALRELRASLVLKP